MKRLLLLGLIIFASFSTIKALDIDEAGAAMLIKVTLKENGYICSVTSVDHDNNGIIDFHVVYLSGNENKKQAHLMGMVTGSVAGVTAKTKWRSDKVFLSIGNDHWITTTAKCRKCMKHTDQNKLGFCILSIWRKITE